MWKKIWESGILRDAGLFAGAYVGLRAAKSFKKQPRFAIFDEYPNLQKTVLVQHIAALEHLSSCVQLRRIANECEEFLVLLHGDIRLNGHAINEKTARIPHMIEDLLKECMGGRDSGVALKAMDFEKDHLEFVKTFLDDSLHNGLLDAKPY